MNKFIVPVDWQQSPMYLIVHKGTNRWLTEGGTRAKLTNDLPPRLFNATNGARNALRWWCDGPAWADEDGYIHQATREQRPAVDEMLVLQVYVGYLSNMVPATTSPTIPAGP